MERPLNSELFELERPLPDEEITRQAQTIVGFAERFDRLEADLRLLADHDGLEDWSANHYGRRLPLLDTLQTRYPLMIFHGDVGTGKTATAEAAANELTRRLKATSILFKLSTRVRGEGQVGQMSSLINRAFALIADEAGKKRTAYLIIDEADSLGASREQHHSHHEDKVAVNTIIQKVDDLRRFDGRIVVFLVTNRFSALDPAVIRRAMRIERFDRPNEFERRAVLEMDLEGIGLDVGAFDNLVRLTGPNGGRPGFTYSDLRLRLLPDAVARAFMAGAPLAGEDLLAAAKDMESSPVVGRQS